MKNTQFEHFLRNYIRSVSTKDKINFFRQMAILTSAGVTFLDSLRMLRKSARGQMKNIIGDTVVLIEQGKDFSSIGKYYIKFFDRTMLSMIKAAETSGTLPETMQQIYENLKRYSEFARKIKGAMFMPVITLVLAIGVLFYMAIKVIPTFSAFLGSMGKKLPPLTVSVIDFSNFIVEKWRDILMYSSISIGIFFIVYTYIAPIRSIIHHIILRTPLIGPVVLYFSLSSFANSMAKLINSGVGIVESMTIAAEGAKLMPLKEIFERAIKTITVGGNVSTSFEQSKLIPPVFSDLLKSGEMSGTLDKTLIQLSDIYKEEADNRVSILQTAIQPIMTILIGFIVGVIAAALVMGMVSLWAKQGV